MLPITPGVWAALMVCGSFDEPLDNCPYGSVIRAAGDMKDREGFVTDVVSLYSETSGTLHLVVAFNKKLSQYLLLGGWHEDDIGLVTPQDFIGSPRVEALIKTARERQRWLIESNVTWSWKPLFFLIGMILAAAPILVLGETITSSGEYWILVALFLGLWTFVTTPWIIKQLFSKRVAEAIRKDKRSSEIEAEFRLLPEPA